MMPKPLQVGGVPIWVSGTINPRVVRRLARFGSGWIPWGPAAADPVAGIAEMRTLLADAGRDPEGLQVTGALRMVTDRRRLARSRPHDGGGARARGRRSHRRPCRRPTARGRVGRGRGAERARGCVPRRGRTHRRLNTPYHEEDTPMTAAPTDAPPLGFWKIAETFPDHLALVDPDEREISAGELVASCNQLVHGLRAMGLEPGDAIAMLLPNSAEVFELYLAVGQAGFYLIPINWHLVGPEIAYIVQDCEAKVFVAHARFAEHAKAAADEISFPEEGRFAVGGGIDTFTRVRAAEGRSADHRTRRSPDGPGDELHVGHDRAPEGRAARAAGRRPRDRGRHVRRDALPLRVATVRRQRAHRRFAAVPHRGAGVLRRGHAHRPHGRGDGQVDAAADAPPHRQVPRDQHAHGADPVRAAAWGCPRTSARSTTSRRCGT